MAQVPAPARWRRILRLGLARLGGAWLAGRLPGALGSERAALAARAAGAPARPADPVVVFLIPLVGRHHVTDWEVVVQRLAATLASLRRQSAPRWIALVCGQDQPALDWDDQVRFVPFVRPVAGNDKWDKLAQLAEALDALGVDGYAMPFDADDLAAPGLVAAITARRPAGGALVTQGLVRDMGRALVARARPRSLRHPRQKAFWKLCGSCAAFRYRPGEGALIAAITAHEHRMFPYLAALAGRPLTPLGQDGVLYLLNHGENFGARRGRVSFKARFVARHALHDPQEQARIAATFPEG